MTLIFTISPIVKISFFSSLFPIISHVADSLVSTIAHLLRKYTITIYKKKHKSEFTLFVLLFVYKILSLFMH